MFGRLLVVFVRMQPMTMRLLSMMSFGFVLALGMRLVGFAMMLSRGFVMGRRLFVMSVLGHLKLHEDSGIARVDMSTRGGSPPTVSNVSPE